MTAPQYGQAGPGPGPAPNNNLVWAILTTIFCCLPLGIVAIVKAAQVNSLWAQGQYDAARKSAEDAKKWSIWSAVAAAILAVIYVIVFVVIGVAANS